MLPLYILKIGGSVATYKDQSKIAIRQKLLARVAKILVKQKKFFDLILIHGAGGAAHNLAYKFDLKSGAKKDPKKWQGSILSRITNQDLDLQILKILFKNGLKIVPVHTASVIINNNHQITTFTLDHIKEALKNKCIPMLYGDVVFDKKLGMSICSGDLIAPYLAKKLKAQKIYYASDIDGIFDKDPYLYKNAKLITNTSLDEIKNNYTGKSHNIDVTGGLGGKIDKLKILKDSNVNQIEIFNGLKTTNYIKIFSNAQFNHTIIKIKSSL